MLTDARKRARYAGLPFDLTEDDIYIPEKCPVFGFDMQIAEGHCRDNSPSLDRLVPAKGYVKGNVIVVSNKANRARGDLTLMEMVRLVGFYRRRLSERRLQRQ